MHYKFNKIFILIVFILSILCFGCVSMMNHTITLNGDKYVTIALNEEYKELGASNTFNDSKYIDINGSVDNTKVGTYKIEYKSNVFGFSIKRYRYIDVVDREAPVIELIGSDKITLCPNGKYKELGYKAYDNYEGDLTKDVDVNISDDTITYSVKDKSGNSFKVNRTLKRVDNETPKLKLKGNSSYNLVVGSSFTDPGYIVSDNCDSNVNVTISGSVDTSKVGTYELVYKAVDSSNNSVTVKRYVKISEKSNHTGVIYLTFDDGPSSSSTPKVLDILKKKGVKATFFVINHDDSLDYLIKRAYDEGHTIALHSYTHSYSKIYSSTSSFYNDLDLISKKVERITGEKSMIMRFPGGGSNTVSRRYKKGIMSFLTKDVIDKGYRYYDWNVGSGDAGGARNSQDVYNNVVNGLRKNRNNIVLMHDFSNSKSVNALEAIIDYGLANGYRFDKIDMTTPMIRHGVNN